MQPHRRQPTRLPRPWDSPGKNTGVGCHFLLQCMKVKSKSEIAQSCPTLSDPMDCSLPAPPSMGFSRQDYWSGVPLPSPAQGMVSAKSLGRDGTWDNQETARKPMWQDQSRLGTVIMGAQMGGKALPWHRQRCQMLPEEGLRKTALNNKISSNHPLEVNCV